MRMPLSILLFFPLTTATSTNTTTSTNQAEYQKFSKLFGPTLWGQCGHLGSEGNCGQSGTPEAVCVAQAENVCSSSADCIGFAVRKRPSSMTYVTYTDRDCVEQRMADDAGDHCDIYLKKTPTPAPTPAPTTAPTPAIFVELHKARSEHSGLQEVQKESWSLQETLGTKVTSLEEQLLTASRSGSDFERSLQASSPYYQMKQGSCCCPDGARIISKDECRIAHDALGLNRIDEWSAYYERIPGGCSTRQFPDPEGRADKDLHWNTHEPGQARFDITPICKEEDGGKTVIILAIVGAVVGVLCLCGFLFFFRKSRRMRREKPRSQTGCGDEEKLPAEPIGVVQVPVIVPPVIVPPVILAELVEANPEDPESNELKEGKVIT